MRLVMCALIAAVLSLGGCSRAIEKAVSENVAAPGEEWTLHTVGDEANRVFFVQGPHGQFAAARIENGKSTLLADAEAQGLLEKQGLVSSEPLPEKVAITAPGVSLKVSADDNGNGADRGRVNIQAGGVSIKVDGKDTGGGDGDVNISGVNAEAARKFVDDIDQLSPEVKKQMREKLGL